MTMTTTWIHLEDFKVGTEYAVIVGKPTKNTVKPLRPMKGTWDGQTMRVVNPDRPDKPVLKQNALGLTVLGEWSARPHPLWGPVESTMTWQGVAAHAYGQVLRQRALVDRLAEVGIRRSPEPYVVTGRAPNSVMRSLQLTYDELDELLDRAGV